MRGLLLVLCRLRLLLVLLGGGGSSAGAVGRRVHHLRVCGRAGGVPGRRGGRGRSRRWPGREASVVAGQRVGPWVWARAWALLGSPVSLCHQLEALQECQGRLAAAGIGSSRRERRSEMTGCPQSLGGPRRLEVVGAGRFVLRCLGRRSFLSMGQAPRELHDGGSAVLNDGLMDMSRASARFDEYLCLAGRAREACGVVTL